MDAIDKLHARVDSHGCEISAMWLAMDHKAFARIKNAFLGEAIVDITSLATVSAYTVESLQESGVLRHEVIKSRFDSVYDELAKDEKARIVPYFLLHMGMFDGFTFGAECQSQVACMTVQMLIWFTKKTVILTGIDKVNTHPIWLIHTKPWSRESRFLLLNNLSADEVLEAVLSGFKVIKDNRHDQDRGYQYYQYLFMDEGYERFRVKANQ